MKYNAHIISYDTFKGITGEMPVFQEGFLVNRGDWHECLERYLNQAIISVRPSGRKSWNEIIVITTDGYIKPDGKIVLHGTLEECKQILADIFMEADNDEYEVFTFYEFENLSKNEVKQLTRWIHKVY